MGAVRRQAQELLVALLRALRALLTALPLLLRLLRERRRQGNDDDKRPVPCVEIPPHIRRRPDPCLYSQAFLIEQGQPVTWDNPDIWLTEMDGTLVSSGALEPGHDYDVHVRIHNASFDPALGTSVTCRSRDWGFSGSFFEPIEVDVIGNEVVRTVHVAGWGNEIATFRWRTPEQAGHYCILATCHHAEDVRPGNNQGQENTRVISDLPAGAPIPALLANLTDLVVQLRFEADAYQIPDARVELRLRTHTQPVRQRPRWVRGDAQGTTTGAADLVEGRHAGGGSDGPTFVGWSYHGRSNLERINDDARASLPHGTKVTIDGAPLDETIQLGPGEERVVDVGVLVDGAAPPIINVTALDAGGRLVGGVTLSTRGGV